MYEYDLFAVICHEGQIDNGHYTNFARFQEEVGVNSILVPSRVFSLNVGSSGTGLMMRR